MIAIEVIYSNSHYTHMQTHARKTKKEDKLNPELEKKIEQIESGLVKGKQYTPDEYLKHVKEVLQD